jgi:ubiquitin carboxyl-terminal hydrolase 25/28
MEDIRKQIQGLKDEIDAAYATYNTNPYHLHAVCVHDGDANSGHYYTYIKDHFNKKWIKFDDIRISEVTEEEVIRNSEGGHEKKTGYWVVYVKESDLEIMKS